MPYEVYLRFYVGIRLRAQNKRHCFLPEGQQPYHYCRASHCLMPSPWQPAASIHYWLNVSIWFGPICLLRQAQVQLSYCVKTFLLKVAVIYVVIKKCTQRHALLLLSCSLPPSSLQVMVHHLATQQSTTRGGFMLRLIEEMDDTIVVSHD